METHRGTYTDCASCARFRKDIFKFRSFPRGMFVPSTRCSCNIIYFILKGEVWVNSKEYPDTVLRDTDIFIQPMGSVVEFRVHTDLEVILFMFEHIQSICNDRFMSLTTFLDNNPQIASTTLVKIPAIQMFLDGLKQSISDNLMCEGYLAAKQTELLYLLNCYYPMQEMGIFLSSTYTPHHGFRAFVLNNYQKVRDVESFANLGGYSLGAFRKQFKENFDEPVYQWMLKQKCKDIYKDITSTNDSIGDISRRYGFDSLANFSHFCKSNFGKSPRAIRAS